MSHAVAMSEFLGWSCILTFRSANDALGTVYFEDEYNDAKSMTNDTLAAFNSLVDSLPPTERARILAANKPKMEQLSEELRLLTDMLIHDDH